QWPDGTVYGQPVAGVPDIDSEFHEHSPVAFVERGVKIDIPVLVRQGASDNLFNLNQGLNNFNRALTWRAKARSIFVGYNGGHALPSLLPPGNHAAGDPCAAAITGNPGAGYDDVARNFLRESLKHESAGIGPRGRYYVATQSGKCVSSRNLSSDTELPVADVLIPSGAGLPVNTLVAKGPITVAGIPHLSATVTTSGLDTRVFLALAVGTSQADTRIVQNNMMPLREPTAVSGASRLIELPGVVVEVPEGQNLYLTVSPVSDMSFAHGARTPGLVSLENSILSLNSRL
ncbi:MAG: peptidase S15, partial [Actinobacteria bacterium]|nr:peptidase S15 [Actinomycetota bacterium]